MKNLYKQLVDLVKKSAFEQAERIHRQYGKQASYIYPSDDHVEIGIARILEDSTDIPREIFKIIIEDEGLTSKLGAIALGSYVKDGDDE